MSRNGARVMRAIPSCASRGALEAGASPSPIPRPTKDGDGAMAWLSGETVGRLSGWLLASRISDGPVFRRINVLTTDAGNDGQQIVRHFIGARGLTWQGVVAILRRRVHEATPRAREQHVEAAAARGLRPPPPRQGAAPDPSP